MAKLKKAVKRFNNFYKKLNEETLKLAEVCDPLLNQIMKEYEMGASVHETTCKLLSLVDQLPPNYRGVRRIYEQVLRLEGGEEVLAPLLNGE